MEAGPEARDAFNVTMGTTGSGVGVDATTTDSAGGASTLMGDSAWLIARGSIPSEVSATEPSGGA